VLPLIVTKGRSQSELQSCVHLLTIGEVMDIATKPIFNLMSIIICSVQKVNLRIVKVFV